MGKGYRGETCAEAIRASIEPGEIVAFCEFFARVKRKGAWKDSTVHQHLMSCVVNLPPARRHWKSRNPFLFLRGDGRYELYNSKKHPEVME